MSLLDLPELTEEHMPPSVQYDEPPQLFTADQVQAAVEAALATLPSTQ